MASPLVDRFVESMVMNHERWHDGTGYDLDLLESATADERRQIEAILLSRNARDWRDIEALAALGTDRSRVRLREILAGADLDLKLALASHARAVLSEEEVVGILIPVLRERGIQNGLVEALLVVEDFHPPAIIGALLDGALHREGAVAMEYATMLLYLHGKITSLYEMEERPFLLRFLEDERRPVFLELCGRVGVAAP